MVREENTRQTFFKYFRNPWQTNQKIFNLYQY